MKLNLTTPWDPGMNDPGQTYPTIFITQMTDNPAGSNFQFIYEAGNFVTVTDAEGNTSTVWSKGPGANAQYATVSDDEYTAAIQAKGTVATDSAYQAIRRMLYMKLIAEGLAGTISDP